ncbi:MAG: hypothetical protein A2539_10390 [Elusimicrobia bacterium RIFOXYD2_FULL_34_15]|nr:MAG: hypothetical protein A2539_10390 [Elusimicrobia bacterium RIFOXYD2_FULL_34_15]
MQYPKISILIPTYNRSGYLSCCIESVLVQDYPNFEVIVSDNASTDNTKQIMEKYLSNKKVRYYRNDTNIGIINNWKKLLYDYAEGEYGKLLCDDDYLLDKEHLKKGMDLITSENIDLVVSGCLQILIGKSEKKIEEVSYDFNIPKITDTNWWLDNGGKKSTGHRLFINFNSGAIFKIKKAKELEAFIPDAFGLDYEILIRFLLSGKTGYLDGHHFAARLHPENDGGAQDFKLALSGTEMFDRLYNYGIVKDLPQEKCLKFKKRNLIVFTSIFLVNKWFRENSVNVKSIYGFYKTISRVEKNIFFEIMTEYSTICWLIRIKNEKMFNFLQKVLRKLKGTKKQYKYDTIF